MGNSHNNFFYSYSAGKDLRRQNQTSTVYRRQILMYKDGPRAERIKAVNIHSGYLSQVVSVRTCVAINCFRTAFHC